MPRGQEYLDVCAILTQHTPVKVIQVLSFIIAPGVGGLINADTVTMCLWMGKG